MKKYLFLLFLGIFSLSGCDSGPDTPTETDLKSMLVGNYCSADRSYRLEIMEDGRYKNRRHRRNPFGGTRLAEVCEGNYAFQQTDEGGWKLIFEKSDTKSNPMVKNCTGEIDIWNPEAGYLVGDSIITLSDPFDQTPVNNQNCGAESL